MVLTEVFISLFFTVSHKNGESSVRRVHSSKFCLDGLVYNLMMVLKKEKL